MISQKLSEPLRNLIMKSEPALADLHRIPDATFKSAADSILTGTASARPDASSLIGLRPFLLLSLASVTVAGDTSIVVSLTHCTAAP
jgi:hypothetical protein